MLVQPRRLRRRIVLLLLAFVGGLGAPSAAAEGPRLHTRVSSPPTLSASLVLPDDDRQWLWRRRTLRVGVSGPDSPPFDLLGNGQHHEGISAEYIALIKELLRLDVQIVAFANREAAVAALREGGIDLLTGAGGEEVGLEGLARSLPYAPDEPVLVRRADNPPQQGARALQTLEATRGYAGAGELVPGYRLRPTPSLLTGLASVALGQADALLGNARSIAAQLAQSPLYGREQVRFLPARPEGVAFLLRDTDSRLLGLINACLTAAPASWREQVDETWSRGAARLSEVAPVVLKPEERMWMAAHPRVRVGYLREFAPLSFENEQGLFRGLAADLLARIGQRTGLVFEPVPVDSHAALIRALERGEVDLAAAMAFDAGAQATLRLSRAWLSAVPVLVTSGAGAPAQALDAAAGQVMVLPASLGLTAILANSWPAIQWQERATAREALREVTGQRAAGAVLPYMQARAMLAGTPGNALRIGGALPLAPRRYAFAAAAGQQPLLSILDRALLSFDPASLDDMARRWRSEVHVEPQWPSQARWLLPAFALAGAMLLLAIVWIRVLRRQVRRRRAAEHALTDQLAFMRVMIDGTPHPVYVRDRAGRLLDCNASYLTALGVEREAVIRQKVTRIPLMNDQAREYEALYRKVIADGQPIVEDRQLRLCNGRQLTVFHWMLPYRASNGSIVGLIGGWIDITERQRLYDALQTAKEQADAANCAKSRFLATASHEIRTPMNAVLGMLELALRKAEKGELDMLALKVASESASGLLELLSDILDISRIESGHLTLNPRPVNIQALATQVVQLYQAKAREKGLHLELSLGPGSDAGVLLDSLRFQQILGNLLSNAIKFTREGEVKVSLSGEPQGNELALRLEVQDTGIGIPQADLRRLCQPYQQAGNHQVSGRAGAGLGLSISQHLCRLMGGSLELTSREGKGSRVQAYLRLVVCESAVAAPEGHAMPARQEAMNVLVVDDHEPNRVLLAQQLSFLGHQVTVAVDGTHGLREWCARGYFDAVICDCEMPGLDGYDLARAIRLEEQRKGLRPCRLLACTADASGGQRERSREAGMDECLTKPLGLEALAAALAPTLPAAPGVSCGESTPPFPGPDALLGLAGGCVASARRLRDSLLLALAQDYKRLQGLRAGSPEVDEVVHRIKGGARIVGATSLVRGCEAVERGESSLAALLADIDCLQCQLRGMQFSQGPTLEPAAPQRTSAAARPKPAA